MKPTVHYSINDLEKLSGIKAHTLRIWEKRYSLFKPQRTDTNIRYYSNDDLKLILNISHLNNSGIKISKIAEMSKEEISKKVTEINVVRTDHDDVINSLIIAMIDLNETFFFQLFSGSILRIGFEPTILKIVFPFFQRIGVMWQTGNINPAQEHFVTHMVRQKLIVAIDALGSTDKNHRGTAILFLPENELHEISLLFYNYLLKARNYKTVYLGQTVPAANLARIAEIVKPDFFLSIVTNPLPASAMASFIKTLQGIYVSKQILLSGRAVLISKRKFPPQIKVFKNAEEFITLL